MACLSVCRGLRPHTYSGPLAAKASEKQFRAFVKREMETAKLEFEIVGVSVGDEVPLMKHLRGKGVDCPWEKDRAEEPRMRACVRVRVRARWACAYDSSACARARARARGRGLAA